MDNMREEGPEKPRNKELSAEAAFMSTSSGTAVVVGLANGRFICFAGNCKLN
jgi:hypothetical protein